MPPWPSTSGTATWPGGPNSWPSTTSQGAVAHSSLEASATARCSAEHDSRIAFHSSSLARAPSSRPVAVVNASGTAWGSR